MKLIILVLCLGVMFVSTPALAVVGPGSALSFNGTNQYVSATIPSLPYNYTISAWVYLRSGGTDSSRLGVLTGAGCDDSVELLIHSTTSSSTDPQYLELGRCNSFNGELSLQTVPLNQWVHIAVTVSYVDKEVVYYINGNNVRTWNGSPYNMYLGPSIHLGDNVTRHFNGLLDEAQIWSRALTQGEIRTNMYQAPDLKDIDLVAYWPMVTDPGSILTPDVSGHGHAGRLVNLPTQGVPNYPWPLGVGLLGANPYTNECHSGFTDSGAFVSNTPVSVDAGDNFTIVLKKDGTVGAWGSLEYNDYGQLNVPSSATNVVALSGGYYFALALRADGAIVGWGDNRFGQLNVPSSATNVVAVSAGGFHSLALRADGAVVAWGYNIYDQCTVPSSATDVVAIAAGSEHSVALKADGTVIAWGRHDYMDLISVPATATNVVAIAAGTEHSLALRADDTILTWGSYSRGHAPTPASATNVIAIAAGKYISLALRADGIVVDWNADGSGTSSVPASVTNTAALGAGGSRRLALKTDGTLIAWGSDSSVPDNTYQLYSVPFTTNGVVDTNAVGSYSRTYTAKNTVSTTTVTRTVNVVDTTAPVMTLLGTNPTIIIVGTPYVDPGATAIDACGGNFTSGILTNGFVNSNVGGGYTQTYTAVDSYNNTGRIQRAIWVSDVPSINNFSNVLVLTQTVSGAHGARFYADVTVKGVAVGTWFQYGMSTNYSNTGPTSSLPAGCYMTNCMLSVSNLPFGVVYHWRVVATSSMGEAVSPDQVAEWAAGAPVIGGYSASLLTTNAATMARGAELHAVVNPNGPDSTAYFQFGPDTGYPWSSTTNNLPTGYADSNIVAALDNLCPGIAYHWRVVASNILGETIGLDQALSVPALYAAGDLDGDGVVEQGELNDVYDGYWQDNPTQITNAMGLGRTEVKLVVDNLLGWDLTAQYSDDLATWSNLPNRAIPVFQFTDPDATNHPTRTYRLLAP